MTVVDEEKRASDNNDCDDDERTRPTSAGSTTTGEGDSTAATVGVSLTTGRSVALVATVTGASFLNTLSSQSVVIILPTIGGELHVPESRQQWIVSSYLLTFGCFLLLWGRIADIYGKRLIFIWGSVWVTAMSIVNPFAPNEISFDLFRGLHGMGAAANVPTAIGILGVTFPPGKAKNYAFSAYSCGAPLGSVFGNLLGGTISNYTSWKWVFGAQAIMAGIITAAGIFAIPSPPPPASLAAAKQRVTVDWIGGVLITVGLIALMFALTEGNVVGWSTPWVPVLLVVSLLIVAVFAAWQWYLETRTSRQPLVKVTLFANAKFSAVMIIMGLYFASFNNFLIFATYFFQDYQGLSPLHTMLRFIPTGVAGLLTIFFVAHMLAKIPTLFILIWAHVAGSLASLLFAVPIPPTTSYFAWGLPAMILSVAGTDALWPCVTLFTSQALPPEDQAVGGALVNAVGQFGRAIGLAIATAVQVAVMADARGVDVGDDGDEGGAAGAIIPWEPASLKGIRAACWLNFAFAIASLFVVLPTFRSLEIIGRPSR